MSRTVSRIALTAATYTYSMRNLASSRRIMPIISFLLNRTELRLRYTFFKHDVRDLIVVRSNECRDCIVTSKSEIAGFDWNKLIKTITVANFGKIITISNDGKRFNYRLFGFIAAVMFILLVYLSSIDELLKSYICNYVHYYVCLRH